MSLPQRQRQHLLASNHPMLAAQAPVLLVQVLQAQAAVTNNDRLTIALGGFCLDY